MMIQCKPSSYVEDIGQRISHGPNSQREELFLTKRVLSCKSLTKRVHMEAMSISWIPDITRRHLPVHVIRGCYGKSPSGSHNGVSKPKRPSAFAIQTNIRNPIKTSIVLVKEAPGCKFLPARIELYRNLGTSSEKGRLCRVPFAFDRHQEDHQARLAEPVRPGSYFCQLAPFFLCSVPHSSNMNERYSQLKSTPSCHWRNAKDLVLRSKKVTRLEAVEAEAETHKNYSAPKIGLGRHISRSGAFRCGRILELKYHFYASSRDTLRASSRVPVPAQNGAGWRLWSFAHSGVETTENLFADLLTIVGLVVFVVCGTYAFAMSQQYLKSDLWFKKNPFESMTSFVCPAKQVHPKRPNLSQTKIAEITDESFYDMIQNRPTFVLFYTDWCPYCQKLDPTWTELGNILSNKGYDIQLARMNPEKHPIATQNLKVVKYPTLIFFKGETVVENYLGPRTVNSLMRFIDERLQNN